ncbi:Polyhomeotic-like protein 2 [Liparis tanakae]|uniref:Polyhomeotic-like protein 2 n=1 Tax=Liparis tanakae TaxID=230148 RepID=A0A4Z2G4Q0_9TELE|nr:Polyhomeotic-like protein 2 [Liparis tanakae]
MIITNGEPSSLSPHHYVQLKKCHSQTGQDAKSTLSHGIKLLLLLLQCLRSSRASLRSEPGSNEKNGVGYQFKENSQRQERLARLRGFHDYGKRGGVARFFTRGVTLGPGGGGAPARSAWTRPIDRRDPSGDDLGIAAETLLCRARGMRKRIPLTNRHAALHGDSVGALLAVARIPDNQEAARGPSAGQTKRSSILLEDRTLPGDGASHPCIASGGPEEIIFTPTATVTAVQSESSTQTSSQNQVQNLAIRGQQGATTSCSQTQTLQALSLKQSPVPIQPASLVKSPSQVTQAFAGGKAGSSDGPFEAGKKGNGAAVPEVRAINMSRSVTALSAQPLIAPDIEKAEVMKRKEMQ